MDSLWIDEQVRDSLAGLMEGWKGEERMEETMDGRIDHTGGQTNRWKER